MKHLLFLVFTLSTCGLFAQPDLIIKDGFQERVLGSELQIFNDTTGTLRPGDLGNVSFRQVESPRPNLGFTSGAYWVKTEIRNESEQSEFIIQINQPILDTVEVFIFDKNEELLEHLLLGEALSHPRPEISERNIRVPFSMETGQERTIFIRIATEEQIALPVYIMTPSQSFVMERTADLLLGGYFGIILIMMLYNFFIFLSVRDYSYLYYVIYIFFVGITQAALEGYTTLVLWPDNFWLSSRSVYIFTGMTSITSIIFQRNFLKTYIYAPRLDQFRKLIIAFFLIIMAIVLYDVNKPIHIAFQVGIVAVASYIFTVSIIVYRGGYSPAKFFLLAWTILLVGIITFALKDAGLIPATPFTNYLLLVGSAVEVLVLSLALADRINILKKEKATSQADALRISLENENIVREQNLMLEEKVSERTSDLEDTNKQLTAALVKLQSTQSQLVNAEKMASLGQLTAGVAHEINNPINFVLANIDPLKYDFADILSILNRYEAIDSEDAFEKNKSEIEAFKKEIDLDYVKDEINQLLEGIKDGAERTAEIVKGLKNFSRLDESNLKYNDLNEGLESTLVILQSNISPGIEVDLNLGNIPKVECLGGKINQVFMNILNNSVQALSMITDKKDLKLTVKSWCDDIFVYFSITDNGPGMDDAVKNRIFDPFYTTKEVGEGTGLGLSISYSIIEMHRGNIEVISSPGEGADFKIKLPIDARIDFNEDQ